MDKDEQKRYEAQVKNLMEKYTIKDLRDMHEKTFGVVVKGKNKERIARKLAEFVITGVKPGEKKEQETKQIEMKPGEEEKIAKSVLFRVRSAWEESERLIEEKKSKSSQLGQVISKAKEKIGDTLKNDKTDPKDKISVLQEHWRTLTRTEEKRTAINQEYSKQIKAARQQMKTEFNNINQLQLFE